MRCTHLTGQELELICKQNLNKPVGESLDLLQKYFYNSVLDAIASGGNPQDRNGALTVVELNSPRVAPLHRFASILVHCSLFSVPCSRQLPRSLLNESAPRKSSLHALVVYNSYQIRFNKTIFKTIKVLA
ncbi:hypothetical protein BJP36_37325 [Moorena producens JHB]|uniref:Uncharacterized protein n=1 Tax=Moorena producens (strain JHB) TaxID=1454205 RepID=A0A9Q9SUA5_MOOP1|nr:hypothetical protein [Moorena producens]WAN69761.1 hypothetical protein BJP36_37325 [Moorena producens JHB]